MMHNELTVCHFLPHMLNTTSWKLADCFLSVQYAKIMSAPTITPSKTFSHKLAYNDSFKLRLKITKCIKLETKIPPAV